ncbi:hypothetical protein BT93_I1561 [Corymbia citriodora subsp. variegata]|nr:hypothetical protein BT93_I1561 [Corymbia citriodora subsp. variegata]
MPKYRERERERESKNQFPYSSEYTNSEEWPPPSLKTKKRKDPIFQALAFLAFLYIRRLLRLPSLPSPLSFLSLSQQRPSRKKPLKEPRRSRKFLVPTSLLLLLLQRKWKPSSSFWLDSRTSSPSSPRKIGTQKQKMAGFLRRKNPSLFLSLHRQTITHFVTKGYSIPRACHLPENEPSARAYFRPRRIPRKAREYHPSPASFSSSPASSRVGFVSWYLGMVKSRPIFTKSVTCGLIYTAADLSSQTIVKSSSEPYDLVRTLRMAGYGLLILGPSLHFWFNCMSRHFPKQDLASTLKKMFMGEALYGPAMTVVFFCVNAGLQGENGTQIVARLKRDLIPTLVSGIMYWPLCDFITLRFTPVHLQPLVSNSFSYIWTIYLTYMASLQKVDSTAKLTTEAAISPP